jgi:hypothetical protein
MQVHQWTAVRDVTFGCKLLSQIFIQNRSKLPILASALSVSITGQQNYYFLVLHNAFSDGQTALFQRILVYSRSVTIVSLSLSWKRTTLNHRAAIGSSLEVPLVGISAPRQLGWAVVGTDDVLARVNPRSALATMPRASYASQ